jgi:hypothetical protein
MKKRIALVSALLGATVVAFAGIASAGANAGTTTVGSCVFTTKNATWTLNADCATSTTIVVPNGYTLNGGNHTITVVDPAAGDFDGAVVASDGAVMNVQNLTINGATQTGADHCDRVFNGIALTNASGSISNVTLNNIGLPETGCQLGRAILVDDTTAGTTQSVTIQNNTISNYNKNGIDVRGNVAAKISGNTVTTTTSALIARNGMVIRGGATADVWSNTVSGNHYTVNTNVASGVLAYDSGKINMAKGPNTLADNDVPQNNDGGSFAGKWAVSP